MKIKLAIEVEVDEDAYEHVYGNQPTVIDVETHIRDFFLGDYRATGIVGINQWSAETEDGPITDADREAAWESEEAARIARADAYEASRRNG